MSAHLKYLFDGHVSNIYFTPKSAANSKHSCNIFLIILMVVILDYFQ